MKPYVFEFCSYCGARPGYKGGRCMLHPEANVLTGTKYDCDNARKAFERAAAESRGES